MHAPQRPSLLVKGDITLPHCSFQSSCGKFPLTPTAGKKPPLIVERVELNYIGPRKARFGKDQGSPCRLSELINFNCWDWYYEFGVPVPDVGHLLHDLFFDIPRQNKQIIRSGLAQHLRRVNRQMSSR